MVDSFAIMCDLQQMGAGRHVPRRLFVAPLRKRQPLAKLACADQNEPRPRQARDKTGSIRPWPRQARPRVSHGARQAEARASQGARDGVAQPYVVAQAWWFVYI